MSENKNYTLIKTTPNDVLFDLHPLLNVGLTRRIYLTNKNPRQILPLDWALGIFQDEGLFSMYRQGFFTFDDNESIVKEAFNAGVYFGDELDFVPAKVDQSKEIFVTLQSGNRANILKAIEKYGKDEVKDVAVQNITNLTQGVINMLENTLGVQLVLDEQ